MVVTEVYLGRSVDVLGRFVWRLLGVENSAVQSKNVVCAFIKHSKYFLKHFISVHSHAKKLYLHMCDIYSRCCL